ncbi:MAG: CapA family protein [Spirochaetia bacterium]
MKGKNLPVMFFSPYPKENSGAVFSIRLAVGLWLLGLFVPLFPSSTLNAQRVPPIEEPKRAPAHTLIMTFAGDVYLPDLSSRDKLALDPLVLYQHIAPLLHGDDASFVDIAAPLIDQGAPRELELAQMADIDALVKAGFDVFSMANQNMLMQDRAALWETEKNWQVIWQRYPWIRHNGIAQADRPFLSSTIFSRQNKKIGFLAMAYTDREELKSAPVPRTVNAVDFLDAQQWDLVKAHIRKISQEVDLVVVSYHGHHPDAQKNELWADALRQLIDAGAHIVWNHHYFEHHRPIEFYQGRIIIHNTGTLLSNKSWTHQADVEDLKQAHTGNSVLYRVTLHWYKPRVGESHERFIVEAMPLSNYQDPKLGRVIFRSDDQRFLKTLPQVWQEYYENTLGGWSAPPHRSPLIS